jgi:hypothetical protein
LLSEIIRLFAFRNLFKIFTTSFFTLADSAIATLKVIFLFSPVHVKEMPLIHSSSVQLILPSRKQQSLPFCRPTTVDPGAPGVAPPSRTK